jgi:hypothetical protein
LQNAFATGHPYSFALAIMAGNFSAISLHPTGGQDPFLHEYITIAVEEIFLHRSMRTLSVSGSRDATAQSPKLFS